MAKSGSESPDSEEQPKNFDLKFYQRIRNVLLDISETGREDDLANLYQPHLNPTRSEIFSGWILLSEPEVTPKKKKSGPRNADDSRTDYVSSNIRKTRGHATVADALESGYFERTLWKGCVDPRTFRYLPNNGQYRRSKAIVQKVTDNRLPKKAARDKVLTSEQKNLQSQIQQELRREFELMQNQGQWAKAEIERYENDKAIASKQGHFKRSRGDDEKAETKRRERKHMFSEVTHSAPVEGEKSAFPKAPTRSYSPVQLPPISVPLVSSTLVKSRLSDSFNNKLNLVSSTDNTSSTRDRAAQSDSLVPRKTQRSFSEPPPLPTPRNFDENKRIESVDLSSQRLNPGHASAVDIVSVNERTASIPPRPKIQNYTVNKTKKKLSPQQHRKQKQLKEPTLETTWSELVPSNVTHNHQTVKQKTGSPSKESFLKTEQNKRSMKKTSENHPETSSQNQALKPQLRFMTASGEVTFEPQDSRASSVVNHTRNSQEKENHQMVSNDGTPESRSAKEYLVLSSKLTSKKTNAPKTRSDATMQNLQSDAKNMSSPQLSLSSTPFVSSGNFRAQPIGRGKAREKKVEPIPQTTPEFLPKIAGQKCEMALTSHRIV